MRYLLLVLVVLLSGCKYGVCSSYDDCMYKAEHERGTVFQSMNRHLRAIAYKLNDRE